MFWLIAITLSHIIGIADDHSYSGSPVLVPLLIPDLPKLCIADGTVLCIFLLYQFPAFFILCFKRKVLFAFTMTVTGTIRTIRKTRVVF